jgi:hypothetical protein
MASEQWLLDDVSVPFLSYFTAVGSSYKLQNIAYNEEAFGGGYTLAGITSNPTPYQGSRCLNDESWATSGSLLRLKNSDGTDVAGTSFYVDHYYYTGSGAYGGAGFSTFNDTTARIIYMNINNTTLQNKIEANAYDGIGSSSGLLATGAVGQVPTNQWVRIQLKYETWGCSAFRLFLGTNINESAPDYSISWANPFPDATPYAYVGGWAGNLGTAIDDIKIDTAAYPTRGTTTTAKFSIGGAAL